MTATWVVYSIPTRCTYKTLDFLYITGRPTFGKPEQKIKNDCLNVSGNPVIKILAKIWCLITVHQCIRLQHLQPFCWTLFQFASRASWSTWRPTKSAPSAMSRSTRRGRYWAWGKFSRSFLEAVAEAKWYSWKLTVGQVPGFKSRLLLSFFIEINSE